MYVVETWAVRAMMWIHVHIPCTLCSMYRMLQPIKRRESGGGGATDVAKYVRRIEEKEGKSIYTRSLAQPVDITVGVA